MSGPINPRGGRYLGPSLLAAEQLDQLAGQQPRHSVPTTGSIGPVRQDWRMRGKQWLGDMLAKAGTAASTVSAASNVLLDRAGLPGESVRQAVPGAGDLLGLTGAGTGLQDEANGLPLVRMDHGLMSLQVDPRAADVAALAPLGVAAAAHVGKAAVGGVRQASREMVEATGKGASKIWAGPKSATWDAKKAARFEEMEKAGDDFDPHYAWQSTGTARVKDGSLLQEIDDSALELTTDFAPGKPLMSAVKHDKFFEAYPELANELTVDLEIDPNMGQRGWGAYEHKTKRITVRARNKEDARRIMAHEMNHGASRFENRATGGSPDSAGRMVDAALKDPDLPAELRAKLEPLAGDDHAAYKALQDEVLSRAVESRLKMGPAERGMYSPEYSFDLDQDKWIVSHEGTQGVSMADDGTFKPLGPVSKMGKAAAKDMPPFEDLMGMARRVNQETIAARTPAAPAPAPSSLLPEAPAAAAPKEITLNVGLNTNDGAGITEKQVLAELKKLGVKVQTREVANSATEPTLVATLDKPLTPEQAEQLSVALRQEAIAQRVDGAGELYGPAKDKWGPFNPEFFLDPTPARKKVSSLKSSKRKQVEKAARDAGTTVKRDDLKDGSHSVAQRKKQARSLLATQPRELDLEALKKSSLVDRSLIDQALGGHPGVEQAPLVRDLPKTAKSKADAARRVQTIFGGDNFDLIKQQVDRGRRMGGDTYYPSTYPLRARAEEIGADFERVAAGNAGTSAQNKLPNNFASDSVVRYAEKRGITDPTEVKRFADGIAEKFGHQKFFLSPSHTQNYYDLLSGRTTGFDKSQKVSAYRQNLRGNFDPVALDTHELSGLSAGTSLFPQYSRMGSLSSTEYGVMEEAYRNKLAVSLGLRPANAQAGRWYGGGDLTGLFTDPGDFLSTLEHMIQFTAESRGLDTSRKGLQKLLDDYLLGDVTLVPHYKAGLPPLKGKKGGGFIDPTLAAAITAGLGTAAAAPAVKKSLLEVE